MTIIKMMSRPDFIKKQVLMIESDKTKKLKFQNSNLIVVNEENKIILQHSCHRIFLVYVLGDFSITSVLIKNAHKYGFPIAFLNYNLKPYFIINPKNKGNFLLRKKQYVSDRDLEISKYLISNKIENQLRLMKSLRYKTTKEKTVISKISILLRSIDKCKDNQELLGIEGTASKEYFPIYFKNLGFKRRIPRAKQDVFNLLFDIGYFYLFNFIESNVELYGFDTYKGVHHKLFYQRKSLVCDIIEPFRCIIDKKIKKGFNLKQINLDDFYEKNGQYYIKKDFNKKYSQFFLKEILSYKEEIFLYVQKYYRAIMKDKKIEDFPKFYIEGEK